MLIEIILCEMKWKVFLANFFIRSLKRSSIDTRITFRVNEMEVRENSTWIVSSCWQKIRILTKYMHCWSGWNAERLGMRGSCQHEERVCQVSILLFIFKCAIRFRMWGIVDYTLFCCLYIYLSSSMRVKAFYLMCWLTFRGSSWG